jgi:branched-chain amino acid transport system substrate-binding protein
MAAAGKTITPQTIVTALESMKKVVIGGYTLDFSPTNHHGSNFLETVVMGPRGRCMRLAAAVSCYSAP